jgi:hypothetical protein
VKSAPGPAWCVRKRPAVDLTAPRVTRENAVAFTEEVELIRKAIGYENAEAHHKWQRVSRLRELSFSGAIRPHHIALRFPSVNLPLDFDASLTSNVCSRGESDDGGTNPTV